MPGPEVGGRVDQRRRGVEPNLNAQHAETGGKLKAAAQMTSIVLLLLPDGVGPVDFYDVGLVLMYISVVLAVASGVKYGIAFWRRLQ